MTWSSSYTDIYFNRPGRPAPLTQLFNDIESTEHWLVVASAWFTDTDIADAIMRSEAKEKLVILNRSDLSRGNRKAFQMLTDYFDQNSEYAGIYTLGSEDWTEGVMHHKFVVTEQSVWLGSFNLTFQARTNYETLVRLSGEMVVQSFLSEARSLMNEEMLPSLMRGARLNGAFRCRYCAKIFPQEKSGYRDGYWWTCLPCKENKSK